MFEYAISDGEGTLVDYGVLEYDNMTSLWRVVLELRYTYIFAPCEDMCETGK